MNIIELGRYIKTNINPYDVVALYGLTPNRAGYVPCPFHAENTASCRVYKRPEKGWHCFGCGLGGSAIDWVMRSEGVGFPEAVRILDEQLGLKMLEVDNPFASARKQRTAAHTKKISKMFDDFFDDYEKTLDKKKFGLYRLLQEIEQTPPQDRSVHQWNEILSLMDEVQNIEVEREQMRKSKEVIRECLTTL